MSGEPQSLQENQSRWNRTADLGSHLQSPFLFVLTRQTTDHHLLIKDRNSNPYNIHCPIAPVLLLVHHCLEMIVGATLLNQK